MIMMMVVVIDLDQPNFDTMDHFSEVLLASALRHRQITSNHTMHTIQRSVLPISCAHPSSYSVPVMQYTRSTLYCLFTCTAPVPWVLVPCTCTHGTCSGEDWATFIHGASSHTSAGQVVYFPMSITLLAFDLFQVDHFIMFVAVFRHVTRGSIICKKDHTLVNMFNDLRLYYVHDVSG